jgi:hypothetical protein
MPFLVILGYFMDKPMSLSITSTIQFFLIFPLLLSLPPCF